MADDTDLDVASGCALANMARVRPVLDKIADKWTILMLTVLCPRPSRFTAIKRRLDGITHKALADALKRLERDGLVTRTVLPTAPIGVEYAITRSAIHYASLSRRFAHGHSTTVQRLRRPIMSMKAIKQSSERAPAFGSKDREPLFRIGSEAGPLLWVISWLSAHERESIEADVVA